MQKGVKGPGRAAARTVEAGRLIKKTLRIKRMLIGIDRIKKERRARAGTGGEDHLRPC